MAMESSGSVSGLIGRLKASGEPASVDEATQELWRRVSARLVALARRKMKSRVGLADEEDLALSTFHHVYREMRAGKHEWVDDRNDLWRLFMTITAEKVSKLYRDMSRQKRDYRRTTAECDLPPPDNGQGSACHGGPLANVPGASPDPLETIIVEDLLARLLGAIRDPLIAEVARLRLEGNTNKEIAHRLGLVEKTIERKIALIRRTWLSFGDDDPDDGWGSAASSALPGPAGGARDHGR